ncbi:hypothetical protein [Ponticoccus sp. (in: a-proteobacteria)]|uniref:hypothetical protein n=1 Tax=Ponticoccus sp. (in: a-proteobacteria) TaxID=1925025 RepID=UPI003AB537D1
MTGFSKTSTGKWALYAVLAAGIAVALMGFLAGAFLFGISIAACVLIWILGGWSVSHRQRQQDRALRRAVAAQRRAGALADRDAPPTR